MESGNKANIEFVKAGDKVNMFFEEKRNLNKYNRMSSHIGKGGVGNNLLAFSSKSVVHGTIHKKSTMPAGPEPDLFAKGPINIEALLEAEKKEKEADQQPMGRQLSIAGRAQRLSMWSKGKQEDARQLSDSDEDDTEI